MIRFLATALMSAVAATLLLSPSSAGAGSRTGPMQFALRQQDPQSGCAGKCKLWIAASGAIATDSARDFEMFAQTRNLAGATVVLDSDGGSVHGAIALGRVIRRLGLDTAVGRIVDIRGVDLDVPRGRYSPRANCESMCGFVLLGGVHRMVPAEARVMVHQIWLGDRRDDPTAATYSAEDLVLVQRDIGKLAQYTIDMGGSIELLDLALRIPPWEPMHALTASELRDTRLATLAPATFAPSTVASAPVVRPIRIVPRVADSAPTLTISERRWSMINEAGAATLARRQPLTVEGEDIGSFDLALACGAGGDSYNVSYIERRHDGSATALPAALNAVTVFVGGKSATLKVISSERRAQPDELITYATGRVPAALIGAFAGVGNHSMMIETRSAGLTTGIRLGNTGAQRNLPRLAAACARAVGDRADLGVAKTGGIAAAK